MDKTILNNAVKLINLIQSEKSCITVKDFILKHPDYFKDIQIKSLILSNNSDAETDYVYIIGYYIYFQKIKKPVTWFQRRRFAKYDTPKKWKEIFQKTLSINPESRFKTLEQLKEHLLKTIENSD